jgi:hypothetical protein
MVVTVWRHPPLLQPSPTLALDHSDLIHAGLLKERAVAWAVHTYSRPEAQRRVEIC